MQCGASSYQIYIIMGGGEEDNSITGEANLLKRAFILQDQL